MTHLRNLTPNTTSDSPYYSQHDQAVADRYKQLVAHQGLGDEIYYEDTDLAGAMQEFGVTVDPSKE